MGEHTGMPSIGDIANQVARAMYEYRIPLVIVSVVAAVGLVAVAHRLGWIAAARRHPGRTAGLLAIALLIGGPVVWYLGSPIFIRTSLVEAGPTAAPLATAPASAQPPSPDPATALPSADPTATPEPTPFVAVTVKSGQFTGTDDFHFGEGTASIIEIEPGRFHIRLEDFSVRNGPDLYVYLSPSPDGWTEDALEVGLLKATDGSFGYDLPPGTDPTDFASAIIWCKQFSHLFATAPFGA